MVLQNKFHLSFNFLFRLKISCFMAPFPNTDFISASNSGVSRVWSEGCILLSCLPLSLHIEQLPSCFPGHQSGPAVAGAPVMTLKTLQTQALGWQVLPGWPRGVPPPGPEAARQWSAAVCDLPSQAQGPAAQGPAPGGGQQPCPGDRSVLCSRAAHPWFTEMGLRFCPACAPPLSPTMLLPPRIRGGTSVSAHTDYSRTTPSLPRCLRACLSPWLTRQTLPSSDSPAFALAATFVSEGYAFC